MTDIKFGGKLIADLSDDELWAAIRTVADMDNFRFDKFKDPRINRSKHRLNRIFYGKQPEENKTFTDLTAALNSEFSNRNKQNASEN